MTTEHETADSSATPSSTSPKSTSSGSNESAQTSASKRKHRADKSHTRGKHKSKGKRSRGEKAPIIISYKELLRRFVACGRCGYFLTGYRVIHGHNALKAAVANSKDGWLDLVWNKATRDLVNHSFGIHAEADVFHFELCCEECQRRIIYDEVELETPNVDPNVDTSESEDTPPLQADHGSDTQNEKAPIQKASETKFRVEIKAR